MKITMVIEGPDKELNEFCGNIIRNAPQSVEVDFSTILVEKDDEPQHEHLKDTDRE